MCRPRAPSRAGILESHSFSKPWKHGGAFLPSVIAHLELFIRLRGEPPQALPEKFKGHSQNLRVTSQNLRVTSRQSTIKTDRPRRVCAVRGSAPEISRSGGRPDQRFCTPPPPAPRHSPAMYDRAMPKDAWRSIPRAVMRCHPSSTSARNGRVLRPVCPLLSSPSSYL